MWSCPACGARFVQRNLSHSCVRVSIDDFLAGKPPVAVALFHRFVAEVRTLGPVLLHPVKTRVALMVEVRFASINRFGRDDIDGHLWLKERVDSDKFRRVDELGRDFIHHFRMTDPTFLDREFRGYLAQAYAIGRREHLPARKKKPARR